MPEEDIQQLGNIIELSGFKEIDGGSAVIIRKIVGNYARKLSDKVQGFEKLSLTMKKIHQATEDSQGIFELHGKAVANGKAYTSKLEDRNLFVAVDKVLTKLSHELELK